MRKRLCLALALILSGIASGAAVFSPEAQVSKIEPEPSGVMLTLSDGARLRVSALSPVVFHVASFPAGAPDSLPPSQAAVMEPDDIPVRVTSDKEQVEVATSATSAMIDRLTGKVAFYAADGSLLLAESGGIDNSGSVKRVSFYTPEDQYFHGAGERGHSLALNGDTLTMYNRQNYGYTGSDPRISQMGISVPWFVSDAGFGVLFDDYNRAELVMGADSISYVSATPAPLSYYFVNGLGSMEGAMEGYAALTGHQPLPPLWALGYITSKYGYKTQQETLQVVDSLKNLGYPLDGVVLDLYWYGQETDMGRLEWNKDQFPDHRKMLADLKAKGVNTVTISQPYINKIGALDNYNMLSSRGMLARDSLGRTHDVTTWVGDAGMFDVSNPDTREWLWRRYRDLTDDGIAGWWGDLGEPEVHPSTIRHANGQTAEQFHNAYGNEWSRLIYEGYLADYPEVRPLLMMRGGTAGLQRYGVFPWTTDVSRSWDGFEPQIALMLSSGLSGLGYMGSDVGGFAVDEANPVDPELYVRWLQMGAFSPMMRTHAQDRPEPYNYPEYEDVLKRFVRMRYEWLPYNYTLAFENAMFGLPLARPLNFYGDTPGSEAATIRDEYLWGSEVLVAPVMTQGARKRTVWFPAGEWVDWRDPRKRYAGLTSAEVDAPLSELPLFVRAGAFIPRTLQPIENTSQYDPSQLTITYFPSSEISTYLLYDDNRLSPRSLQEGAFRLVSFQGIADPEEGMIITLGAEGSYEGMPAEAVYDFEVPGLAKQPASVKVNGEPLPDSAWSFDSATSTLRFTLRWPYTRTLITIE